MKKYNNNLEYRKQIRLLTSMDNDICTKNVNNVQENLDEDIDNESKDELFYDTKTMSEFIDFILNETKQNKLFLQLYIKTAGQMFSNSPEIGLTILLSYDYLFDFHLCLVDFFKKNDNISDNLHYKNLISSV
tara:strand:- start:1043 stop:1438 length:396 start_codon:yes stop_codon:yes gene_type:complete